MPNLNTRALGRRRQAISGIFIALIIFAAIFSAGVGYYVFAGQAWLSSAQDALAKQGAAQGANEESLTVTTGLASGSTCVGCVLEVNASNSGGVTVTITAVFVTTPSGKALSSSTNPSTLGSEFLTSGDEQTGDLNVTLPISLAVGEGTGSLMGCGTSVGCAIGIRSASCLSCLTSGNVYVSVLTSRGNTFSAEYCPSGCATGGGQTTTNTVTSMITSTSTVVYGASTVTTLSAATGSTVVSGFQPGTNSLVVSMEACAGTTSPSQAYGTTCASPQPPAVYSAEEVILLITVTNFANVGMNVVADFQAVATGGAGATPQSSSTTPPIPSGAESCLGGQTGTAQNVAANGGTATFVCTFIAAQGSSGGTITFLGYAVGTYPIPPATPTGQVTSAETLSNPIYVGNPLSSVIGPFVGVSFDYASKESTTFGSGVQVSNSGNEYVIWQATLENTANASVTILEYSFLLAARVAQEHDFYIVQPVSSWTSTSLSAYTCASGTGNAPTGAQCSTAQTNCKTLGNGCVPTGDNATLDFAASGIAGTAWEWGTSGGFNPPESITMFVIVEYDYYNAGAWHVLAQAVPFTGTYLPS
jgi:hypothetical protein